jgi:hypothetical protein
MAVLMTASLPLAYARQSIFFKKSLFKMDARIKSGHDSCAYLLKSRSTPLATSLFQMNSTISAPMVAVMKPAPWSGL